MVDNARRLQRPDRLPTDRHLERGSQSSARGAPSSASATSSSVSACRAPDRSSRQPQPAESTPLADEESLVSLNDPRDRRPAMPASTFTKRPEGRRGQPVPCELCYRPLVSGEERFCASCKRKAEATRTALAHPPLTAADASFLGQRADLGTRPPTVAMKRTPDPPASLAIQRHGSRKARLRIQRTTIRVTPSRFVERSPRSRPRRPQEGYRHDRRRLA
jgi:hypothetical protein